MESESREVPAASIASAARAMADRWLWIALVPGVIALLFALTIIAGMNGTHHGHAHSTAAYVGGMVLANVICVGLPGALALACLFRARRYRAFAKRATSELDLTWHLAGKIVAAARGGAPVPELAFPVAGHLRRSLTAVPRASLVK